MELAAIGESLEALSDPTRLRLLHLLFIDQDRRWSVGALVEALRLPQPTVSRHLARLRSADLVRCDTEGRTRLYRLAEPQRRLHAAVLAALEPFVSGTPEAREDAARAGSPGLTRRPKNETVRFYNEDEPPVDDVFHALSHPARRRVLDAVRDRPGCTVQHVCGFFALSRPAVVKHLRVLEEAGLVHSMRRGRERRLYANSVPIQLIYDRWSDAFSGPLATFMTRVKRRVEGDHPAESSEGDEEP